METNNKLMVERETYEKNGKTYFTHIIKGVVRGKEVKISLIPHDIGGYSVLDIVFGDAMAAEFVLKPYSMTDEKTGRVISGYTYAVRSEIDGEVYECALKPSRKSDKYLLDMLLAKVAKQV